MEDEVDQYRGATELWMDCEGGYCCAQAQAVMDALVEQRNEAEAHRDELVADSEKALGEWATLSRAFEVGFREIESQVTSLTASVRVLQDDRAQLEKAVLVLGPIVLANAQLWADLDATGVDEAMSVFQRVQADVGVRGE